MPSNLSVVASEAMEPLLAAPVLYFMATVEELASPGGAKYEASRCYVAPEPPEAPLTGHVFANPLAAALFYAQNTGAMPEPAQQVLAIMNQVRAMCAYGDVPIVYCWDRAKDVLSLYARLT